MPKIKVGIVGCGTIGTYLARFVSGELKNEIELAALYDAQPARSRALSRRVCASERLAVDNLGKLIARSELVIEAASAQAALSIAKSVLKAGRDVMIMSTGGILGGLKEIASLARRRAAKVYIPSGAIAGIDAVKAASIGRIKEVVLTTTKNPRSFAGSLYFKKKRMTPQSITKDTVLFSGCARKAVKLFPQNINVAAVLGLAGIGDKKTRVKIIASPGTSANSHEISVRSSSGTIRTVTGNVPHPSNPKTSFLAALSAAATLQKIVGPVVIGT